MPLICGVLPNSVRKDDKRLIQHSTVLEIRQEDGGAAVENRQHGVLEAVKVVDVGVPVVALGAVQVTRRADHGQGL